MQGVNSLICEGFVVQALHLFSPVIVFPHDVLVKNSSDEDISVQLYELKGIENG